jgi:hypothetical protein
MKSILEYINENYTDLDYDNILNELSDEIGPDMAEDIERYTYDWLDGKFNGNKSKIKKFETELNNSSSKILDELTEYIVDEFGDPDTGILYDALECFCHTWIKENK